MSYLTEPESQPSHIRFQMWDKYLTVLNKIWDLEQPRGEPGGQTPPEQPATNFQAAFWEQHLLQLNQAWHVSPTLSLAPPTSFAGKLLAPLKKLLLRWLQPSIEGLVQQQNDLNARLVQTCNGLVEAVNKDIVHTICKLEAQKDFNAQVVQAMNGFVELSDGELRRLRTELRKEFRKEFSDFRREFSDFRREFSELRIMVWIFDRRKEALEIDEILLHQKLERILSLLKEQLLPQPPEIGAPPPSKTPDRNFPVQARQADYAYVLFENRYRGDEASIKQRQAEYLPYFQNCANVLDLGCGRGEFLELLRERQIAGYGVDANQNMLYYCRQKGLRVEEADIFAHLAALPDDSLDGIFTAQVVEHCAPQDLARLLQLCFAKLQFRKYLVIETQNPKSLYALSYFYRDISHEKPLHPDALCSLVKMAGFQDVQVEYKNQLTKEEMFPEFELPEGSDAALQTHLTALNNHIRRLNDVIYGYLDYAIIAKKVKLF